MNKKNYIVIGLIIVLAIVLTISDYTKSIASNDTTNKSSEETEFKVMEGDKIVTIIDNKYYLVENYNEGETIYHLYDKDRNDIFKDTYEGDIVYADYYDYDPTLRLTYQTARNPYPILSLCGKNKVDSGSIVSTRVSIPYKNGQFETPEVIEKITKKEFLKYYYNVETCEEIMTSTDPNLVFEKNALMSVEMKFNSNDNGFKKIDYVDENTKFENVPVELIYEPRDKETEQIYGKELYILINGKTKVLATITSVEYNNKYILISDGDGDGFGYHFELYNYNGDLLFKVRGSYYFANHILPNELLNFGYKIENNRLYFFESGLTNKDNQMFSNIKFYIKYVDLNDENLSIVTVKEVYGHTGG